jgi:sugar/nucleoside kinase (ribokinase family)
MIADVGCLSYLAAVRTLFVDRYPRADYGAEVLRVERFLAADGPIAAGAAVALGLDAVLLSNGLADDEPGREITALLDRWGVARPAVGLPQRAETPLSTVVCDSAGQRSWFPYLPGVVADLTAADLTPLLAARVAAVDCYEILADAPRRAVAAALDVGINVMANLGGSAPPPWLAEVAGRRHRLHTILTNVSDDNPGQATAMAVASPGLASHRRWSSPRVGTAPSPAAAATL